MMQMTERPVGDVVILDLHGTIAPGLAEVGLGDKVKSILYGGCRKLLLNLAGVTSSDASGVSALVGALLSARESRAEVKLLNVTQRLTDILIIVALYRYFAAFDAEQEALESFRSAAAAPSGSDGASREPWHEAAQAA